MSWSIGPETTCLITGASAGIGQQTALGLAKLGATVIVAGRNPHRTAQVAAELRRTSGNPRIAHMLADLSSLEQVRGLADEVLAGYPRLHLLVNNAGVWHPRRRLSHDGYEDTLAVNHLAPFLLSKLLMPRMRASAPARIIQVSSRLHAAATRIDFEDLHYERRYYGVGFGAYAQAKLALMLSCGELARRLAGSGVTANCVHPGDVATMVARDHWLTRKGLALVRPLLRTPSEGAATTLWAATAPELSHISGAYFADCAPKKPSEASRNRLAAERLWRLSAQLAGCDNRRANAAKRLHKASFGPGRA